MLTVIRWQEMHRRQRRRLRIRRQTIHRRQERSRLRWLRRRRQLTPAGRRQSHQQYQSRVMNPSVSGDGWSDEERHERRETVGSKCDTAEGEGGWWREQPPHCDSAFMQVSCGFHPGAGVRFHLLRWDPTRSARGPALRPVNRRKTLQPVKHAQPP